MPHPPQNEAELVSLLDPPTAPGELGRLHPFSVLEWLGDGGMGFVCRVRDAANIEVALKVLKPDHAADPRYRKRFLREAALLEKVQHENVVAVRGFGEVTLRHAGQDLVVPYIAMEFLRGRTLKNHLQAGLPSWRDLLVLARQLLLGLGAVHAAGLTHRDIKPANLWIDGNGRLKVLDLGLARAPDHSHYTSTDCLVGTPAFMSPEQVKGEEVDPRSDLFSAGAVLYLAATGQRPFTQVTTSELFQAIREQTPPRPSQINALLPPVIDLFVMRLLRKDRDMRYASAVEALAELDNVEAAINGHGVGLPLPDATTLELTFADVQGSPWQGNVVLRWQGRSLPPRPVVEGLTAKERLDLRWYVEEFMDLPEGGNAVRAEAVEKRLRLYGEELWRQLSGPDANAWLAAVQSRGAGRLVLWARGPGDEAAFRTAWELMRVGEAGGTPLHSLGVSVVRRVPTALTPPAPLDTTQGLRVLVVVARPEGAGFLDPRYTPVAILDALQDRPEVHVDFCRPPTLTALVRALEQARDDGDPYHVVHFDGHGTATEAGLGLLCFEDDEGQLDKVKADRLGTLLAGFHIPLTVLAACRTSMKESAEETVAAALLRQGVGTVVAMGYAVHVDMDRHLIAAFYEDLARGKTLGVALQGGRKALIANPRRRLGYGADAPEVALQDWFVPQLYQAGDDAPLLSPKTKPRGRTKAKAADLLGFPPPPRAGFQGRGRELHRLERLVSKSRAVVLHAPGGTGKTALAREAAAWWLRTRLFPDGAAFASLENAPSPTAVAQRIGELLEGEKIYQRPDPAAQVARLLSKKRMLIVWDNYESVLPAFNGGEATPPEFAAMAEAWTAGGSRLLVTCRDAEVGLPDAWPFPLGELSSVEGLLLLVRFLERLGIDRPQREKQGLTVEALGPIVERLSGHPLALELIAPFLRTIRPEVVADELGPLLLKAKQTHKEGRNQSMAASLLFSTRHLSEEARAALPAVALLAGGCLVNMAPDVVGVDEPTWERLRTELERTGLVRIEGPALRPHPVLGDVPDLEPTPELQARFFAVIGGLCAEFNKLVRSPDALMALTAMGICEAVVRRAIDRATTAGDMHAAWAMADSLKGYLELRGRGGEGGRLMTRLHARFGGNDGEVTETEASLTQEAAMARAGHDPEGARQALEQLLRRLETVSAWDTRFQRARTLMDLGRVHVHVRRCPEDALAPLAEAAARFEALEGEQRIDSHARAAVLGDRANALMFLGRFDEALTAAEESLALNRARHDGLAAARALGQIAQILAAQGQYAEADQRYRDALKEAREAGDDELQGIIAQNRGIMALDRSRPDEALPHLREALAAFQRARNESGQMRVLNSLGNVELQCGRLAEALAWFDQSLELARKLQNIEGEATSRSNRAVIFSTQAQQTDNPDRTRQLLEQAIAEERAVLPLEEQRRQPAPIAISHNNLANYLRRIGALDEAETHARQALALFEQLNHPQTWQTLLILERIAEARGDAAAAAAWRRRKESARIDAELRAGELRLPRDLVTSLLQLALTARQHAVPLERALTEAGVPDEFLAALDAQYSWLTAQLCALAAGAARPDDAVPSAYRDLVDAAWHPTASAPPA